MNQSSLLRTIVLSLVLAANTHAGEPRAFEPAPIREAPELEITVPEAPHLLRAGGKRWLCYELYITNMKDAAFTLQRVKVLAADGAQLLDAQGDDLARALQLAGKIGLSHEKPAPINRGERVVFYVWVELPEDAPIPKSVRHELEFAAAKGDAVFTLRAAETPVLPEGRVIAPPLRGENWFAANGPSNFSHHRRGIITLDGLARVPQRYAIDWSKIDQEGNDFHGDPEVNASYYCYGQEALAVADGVVSGFHDGIPEGKPHKVSRAVPITFETVAGNYVILDIGEGAFAFYAHLQPGKIRVKLGDRVKTGDVIGLVGTSGNSTQPHLHFHLCDRNSPLACQGLPYTIQSLMVPGLADDKAPHGVNWLASPLERHGEMPLENDIISFPK
jgi:hypothetical protein